MEDQKKEEQKIYKVGEYYVPAQMMAAIQRYIKHKYPVGDFLTAVITNNLKESINRADDNNLKNLPAFVHFFYNEAPPQCWGSVENMKNWLESGVAEREKRQNESQKDQTAQGPER